MKHTGPVNFLVAIVQLTYRAGGWAEGECSGAAEAAPFHGRRLCTAMGTAGVCENYIGP